MPGQSRAKIRIFFRGNACFLPLGRVEICPFRNPAWDAVNGELLSSFSHSERTKHMEWWFWVLLVVLVGLVGVLIFLRTRRTDD
jgi:hypothetical protein